MSYKNTQIDGDVSIGRNVAIGGNAKVQGNATVKKNLTVEGWLDAKHIKGVCKGLFKSLESLRHYYPKPCNGWWALVGNSVPCSIYVVEDGEWIATGGSGGNPSINSEVYDKAIERLEQELENKTSVSVVNNLVDGGATSALSAEQGKVLLSEIDKIKTSQILTLSDFNAFPKTHQEGIDFVKAGNSAHFTIVNDGSVKAPMGTVSIFSDFRGHLITEVLETRGRISEDGCALILGHYYQAPKRYYRNYALNYTNAQYGLVQDKWTEWQELRDEQFVRLSNYISNSILIYDCSPDREVRTLAEALDVLGSNDAGYKVISFIDSEKSKRVIYYCDSAELSVNTSDWKRIVTEDELDNYARDSEVLPSVVSFDGFVSNVEAKMQSVIGEVSVVFDSVKKTFVAKRGLIDYYNNWSNGNHYLTWNSGQAMPRSGIIFYHKGSGTIYTWNGEQLVLISNNTVEVKDAASITPEEIDKIIGR